MKLGSLIAALLLAYAGGCVSSRAISADEFDSHWLLDPNPVSDAQPYRVSWGGTNLPSHWTIRQDKSLIRSTVSIVRAVEALRGGADRLDFSVSVTHAEALRSWLADLRRVLDSLDRITGTNGHWSSRRWAEAMAGAMLEIERITQRTSDEAAPAQPLLKALLGYLLETAGDQVSQRQADQRIRLILTQVALHAGFSAVGKEQPTDLVDRVMPLMVGQAAQPRREALADLLERSIEQAPVSLSASPLRSSARAIARWGPDAIATLESFLSQWDRLDRVELDFLRTPAGQLAVKMTFFLLPDRQMRVTGPGGFTPSIVFRGTAGILICPRTPRTHETLVLLAPGPGGAVEVRFDGPVYALARLMLPLESGALREIRIAHSDPAWGANVTNVMTFLEAGPTRDGRRIMAFQHVRQNVLDRQPFEVQSKTQADTLVFNYLTPNRAYTLSRTRSAPAGGK